MRFAAGAGHSPFNGARIGEEMRGVLLLRGGSCAAHSHSMVPGGLEVMSYTTRLTERT